ncbi:MAG: hypothetical protein RJA69_484, partial [Pseudomonadota bacterium]
MPFPTPAPGFAQVHKLDDRRLGLGLHSQFTKEALLLGTGHQHVTALLDRLEISAHLAPTQ